MIDISIFSETNTLTGYTGGPAAAQLCKMEEKSHGMLYNNFVLNSFSIPENYIFIKRERKYSS
jgi:hypothetical protein